MNTTFAQAVLAQIPEVKDSQDYDLMLRDARDLGKEGWTVSEVVSLFRCMEEVNPDLPEDVALRRMATIRSNVEKRLELVRKA